MQCSCEHERHDDGAGSFAGCAHDATGDTRAELVGAICDDCAATCFAEDAAAAKAHGLTPYTVTRTTPGPADERAYMVAPINPDAEPSIDWDALIAEHRANMKPLQEKAAAELRELIRRNS